MKILSQRDGLCKVSVRCCPVAGTGVSGHVSAPEYTKKKYINWISPCTTVSPQKTTLQCWLKCWGGGCVPYYLPFWDRNLISGPTWFLNELFRLRAWYTRTLKAMYTKVLEKPDPTHLFLRKSTGTAKAFRYNTGSGFILQNKEPCWQKLAGYKYPKDKDFPPYRGKEEGMKGKKGTHS